MDNFKIQPVNPKILHEVTIIYSGNILHLRKVAIDWLTC